MDQMVCWVQGCPDHNSKDCTLFKMMDKLPLFRYFLNITYIYKLVQENASKSLTRQKIKCKNPWRTVGCKLCQCESWSGSRFQSCFCLIDQFFPLIINKSGGNEGSQNLCYNIPTPFIRESKPFFSVGVLDIERT